MTNGVIALGSLDPERGVKLDDSAAFKGSCKRMARNKTGRVRVTVELLSSKRSLEQNAYLHAVPFPIIADYIGESIEDVKYDLMGECWGWKPSPLDPNRMVPVKPSTSSMTVEECSKFIDWLIPWALEKLGLSIPYPDERAA